jgi:hypothetical protein
MYSKYTGLEGEIIYPFFYFYSQFYAGGSKVGLSVLLFFLQNIKLNYDCMSTLPNDSKIRKMASS